MRKQSSFQPGGLWLVTFAAILWGTIGIATQAIYNSDDTTSLFLTLARTLIATPVLLIACWRVVGRGMFNIQRRDFGIMALSGVLLAASHAAYFAGIQHAGITISTLLAICVAPLVVSGISVALKLEKLSKRMVIALACALIGTVLLVGFDSVEGQRDDLLLGVMFSLSAAVTYAIVILCGRFLAAKYHPLQVTSVGFSAGSLALLLANLIVGIDPVETAQGWLLIVYLGVVPSALGYLLLQMGLRTVSATAASIVSMLEPTVAALLAWIFFGEKLAASGIAGAALLMVSIFLLSTEKRE